VVLRGQSPAAKEREPGHEGGKPLLGGEGECFFCRLLGARPLPPELMNQDREEQSPHQTIRVRQLPGEAYRFVAPPQGLVGIAQHPEVPYGKAAARYP
jgi:hypothetical protein